MPREAKIDNAHLIAPVMIPPQNTSNSIRPLLDWLLSKHPGTPKTRAKQWILAGRVSVYGVVIRKPHQAIPDPGSGLELLHRHATTLDCGHGWVIHPRLTLLYLDSAFAIVNKGPGLISMPPPEDCPSALGILGDYLAGRLKARDHRVAARSLPPAFRRLEPLPVHRLDQYTSGVFCIALNATARGHLIEQLRAHTMKREYVAFVEGRPLKPKGEWRHWLQLSKDELRQFVVPEPQARGTSRSPGDASEPREAVTHYEVLAEFPLAGGKGVVSKLRLRLETGRKHQLRVQAAHVGLPMIGDRTYNQHYRGKVQPDAPIEFDRQALHAQTLTLEHPDQPKKKMSWTAEFPKDLRQLEAGLRSGRR
jgi:23S rRNA pseudouridine1911/1915/1917 synthase